MPSRLSSLLQVKDTFVSVVGWWCGMLVCAGRQTSSSICEANGNKTEKVEVIKTNELCELIS